MKKTNKAKKSAPAKKPSLEQRLHDLEDCVDELNLDALSNHASISAHRKKIGELEAKIDALESRLQLRGPFAPMPTTPIPEFRGYYHTEWPTHVPFGGNWDKGHWVAKA